jgi:Phage tail lysozyme
MYTVPAVNFYGMLSGIGDTLQSNTDQANAQAQQAYKEALAQQQINQGIAAVNQQPYNAQPLTPPVPQSFMQRLIGGFNGNQPAPAPVVAPVAYNPPAASSPAMQGVLPTAPAAKGVTPEQSATYGNARAWGLPHSGASALVAAISGESGASLDPNSQNNSGTERGGIINPDGSFGMANWNGSRQAQLLNYARQTGGDPKSRATQTAFVQWELQHNYPQVWQKLNDPDLSAQDKLAAVVNDYENPKDKAGAIAARTPYLNALSSLNGGQEQPAGVLGTTATRAAPNLVAGPGVGSVVSPDNAAGAPQAAPEQAAAAPAGTVSFGGRNYTLGQAYQMLQSPAMKQIGEALIKRFGEQTGKFTVLPPGAPGRDKYVSSDDARTLMVDQSSGKVEALSEPKKGNEDQTTTIKDYEFYKKGLPAGTEPMPFDQWSTAKARAAASNINLNTIPDEAAAVINKAKGKVVADAIEAGNIAPNRLRSLSEIADAAKAGGDNITSGPMSDIALRAKQIGSSLGIDVGEGLPASEAIQKVGFGLATQLTKAITSRPTQAEFLYALQNVPGLKMSGPGLQAMSSLLAQEAFQDRAVGRIAMKKGMTPEQFQDEQDKYIEDHPLLSPFTGKPFGSADIQLIAKRAGVTLPEKGAVPSSVPLPLGEGEAQPTFPAGPEAAPTGQTAPPAPQPKRYNYNAQGKLLPQ